MAIEAEQLESWIGAQVTDASGDKLGKVGEVFFRGDDPFAVEIHSGLAGRKKALAVLRGASVSRDGVRLGVGPDTLVEGEAPLTDETIAALAAHDGSLSEVKPADVEGFQERDARLKAAAEAAAKAEAAEAEAAKRREDEQAATGKVDDAQAKAQEARKAREEAEAKARAAREEADGHR